MGSCSQEINGPCNDGRVNDGPNIRALGNVNQSINGHVQESVGQVVETTSEVALVVPFRSGRRIASPCKTDSRPDSRGERAYRARSHCVNRDVRHDRRTRDCCSNEWNGRGLRVRGSMVGLHWQELRVQV